MKRGKLKEDTSKKTWFLGLILAILTLPIIVLAYGFGGWGGYYGISSPADLLNNEWFVFGAIFILVFAVVYFGLLSFFTRSNKPRTFQESFFMTSKVEGNRAIPGVIALIIAFFVASALMQRGYLTNYLSDYIILWVSVIAGIIVLLLAIPFFKRLHASVGAGFAFAITIFVFWIILKMVNLPELVPYQFYSYEFEQIYGLVTSYTFIILAVLLGIVIGALTPKTTRPT